MNVENEKSQVEEELQTASRLGELACSEDGPTATEYAVMLALIIVVALGAIGTLGQNLWAWYVDIQATLFA